MLDKKTYSIKIALNVNFYNHRSKELMNSIQVVYTTMDNLNLYSLTAKTLADYLSEKITGKFIEKFSNLKGSYTYRFSGGMLLFQEPTRFSINLCLGNNGYVANFIMPDIDDFKIAGNMKDENLIRLEDVEVLFIPI